MTIHGADYQIDARQSNRALTEPERRKLVITLHAGAVGAWDWDSLSSWEAPQLIDWGLDTDALKDWKRDVTALDNMLASEMPPEFEPVSIDEQGRLDPKKPVTCPECGAEFAPKS
jgi:hypothetical protein